MWALMFVMFCGGAASKVPSPNLNYDEARTVLESASKTADAVDISKLKLAPFATAEFKEARGNLALAAEWFAGQAEITKGCWNLQGLTLLLQALDFGEVSLSKLQTAIQKSEFAGPRSAAANALDKETTAFEKAGNAFRKKLMEFYEGLDRQLQTCGGNPSPIF